MAKKRRKKSSSRSRTKKKVVTGLSDGVKQSVFATILLAIGVFFLFAYFGSAGPVGASIDGVLALLFGWDRFFAGLIVVLAGWNALFPQRKVFEPIAYLGFLAFFLGFNGLINHVMLAPGEVTDLALQSAGGYIGLLVSAALAGAIGSAGAIIVALALIFIGIIILFNLSFDQAVQMKEKFDESREERRERRLEQQLMMADMDDEDPILSEDEEEEEVLEEDDPSFAQDSSASEDKNRAKPDAAAEEKVMTSKRRRRVQVPTDLLEERSSEAQSGDVDAGAEMIRKTFAHFNIDVEMVDVKVGPTVTQYALKPPRGVKLSRIVSLQNDLALALAAHPIRIEAPIPGKALVGIEVPNETIGAVGLKELLESSDFRRRKSQMTAPLGKDVTGKVISLMVDKAPHMLVAGATGSGKSVALNVIITSLLYQNGPDDLKLIMVDPKRVELGRYAGIPHLLTPPIVKSDEAINALKWGVREMERRLDHLAKHGARDIDSYNKKASERMPKIVIIIDELSDLMSQSKRDVEALIVRIAQMARAAGIHLILATQRPSVDVITGIIKANIPTRLAFAVASQVDSKTILDVSGAEKLLGRGDMLVSNPQHSKPKRLQGAYIDDEEIDRVVAFLKKEGEPDYNEAVVESEKTGSTMLDDADDEPLLEDAIEIVIDSGKASTSYLQRRMRIGYSRAARIVDILEEMGIIGEQNGSKPRDVLVDSWPPESQNDSESEDVSHHDESVEQEHQDSYDDESDGRQAHDFDAPMDDHDASEDEWLEADVRE
jgi:S-DNA-T family DNA segregation ATPase FtsK/SpoIIIE